MKIEGFSLESEALQEEDQAGSGCRDQRYGQAVQPEQGKTWRGPETRQGRRD